MGNFIKKPGKRRLRDEDSRENQDVSKSPPGYQPNNGHLGHIQPSQIQLTIQQLQPRQQQIQNPGEYQFQDRTQYVPPQQEPVEDKKPVSDVCPESIEGEIVIALYDFQRRIPDEVSFDQGDRLLVISEESKDFLYGKHLVTNHEGYIPRTFVCQEWLFEDTSRKDAENLLLKKGNEAGAFLVRKATSGSPFHKYSISVKIINARGIAVRHYRVYQRDEMIYCTKDLNFKNLSQLIAYYKQIPESDNSMTLSTPCLRIFQTYDAPGFTKDEYELDRNDIQLKQRIGAGNFGEVWLGEMQNGTLQVAVKTLKKNSMSVDDFIGEALIMKEMRHQYILPLWGVCSLQEPIFIVTQYMDLGSLLDVLRRHTTIKTLKQRINVAYQVASGMHYLEVQGFIHRDLAARNVLVNSDLDCKICDFGLARICEDEYSPENLKKFPVKWSAPEVIDYHTYTIKSDVWSYGIVLVEIFTDGVVPYPGMNNQVVMAKLKTGYRMKKPAECPVDLFSEIIEKCWKTSPEERPTFAFMESYLDAYDSSTDVKYH